MKKISCILLVVVSVFFACQTDTVTPEIIENDATELNLDLGVFHSIPDCALRLCNICRWLGYH